MVHNEESYYDAGLRTINKHDGDCLSNTLRTMEHHVYCVYAFNCIIKALLERHNAGCFWMVNGGLMVCKGEGKFQKSH